MAVARRKSGLKDAYFGQAVTDGYSIDMARQAKYTNEVRGMEEEVMPNSILTRYFESIYRPLNFQGDPEGAEGQPLEGASRPG